MEKNAYICRVLNREICNLKKEKLWHNLHHMHGLPFLAVPF